MDIESVSEAQDEAAFAAYAVPSITVFLVALLVRGLIALARMLNSKAAHYRSLSRPAGKDEDPFR